ncbi:hypothetical protein TRIP_B310019 [uncultured Desulfatiglans sp.]|uniref:PAC domain-containing protein n=1 Tax=Uncultured Desulfatiglans sp. TaxID=1748965 RepID=A0A653A6V5_UNCDX|nr:hypothetical protein TRIP_B310019 [uncultured Desulfatiglans sp.]
MKKTAFPSFNAYSECGILTYGRLDGRECFLRHKDGHDVPVIKSARLVRDEQGTIEGVVETVTDLTELQKARHEAEEAGLLPQEAPPANSGWPPQPLTRDGLLELLDECAWNKAEAGRRLGVSRTAVWKYNKKWEIPLRK